MPKIRGIHPGYWTDEDIVELSIPARLLFIGLWTYACDNGHLDDKPKQIRMRLFPADDVNVDKLLDELVAQGRIDRTDGTIIIHKFAHHQKPHTRWWSTCDLPLCKPPEGATQRGKKPSQTPQQPLRNGSARVDNGGAPDDVEVDVDFDVEVDKPPSASASAERRAAVDADFASWWELYPRKRDKGHAVKAYRTARKKASADDILAGLRRQLPELLARADEKRPYPATWLNGERWADEVDAPEGQAEQPREPGSVWRQAGFDVHGVR